MLTFRQARPEDIERLLEIEYEGFTKEEAATKEAFEERIAVIADTFIVAEKESEIVGFINGPVIPKRYITDDLFEHIAPNAATGGYQSVLGIAVAKNARKQGIGKQLIQQFEQQVITHEREGITLTCKQQLVAFYEKLGFVNEGLSASQHGGEVWYNLVKLNNALIK